MLSSDEDLDLEDPFVRHDNVRQFRYLRAQFEDETLEPGEIPDLVAEACSPLGGRRELQGQRKLVATADLLGLGVCARGPLGTQTAKLSKVGLVLIVAWRWGGGGGGWGGLVLVVATGAAGVGGGYVVEDDVLARPGPQSRAHGRAPMGCRGCS